jgi:hypothetical protein
MIGYDYSSLHPLSDRLLVSTRICVQTVTSIIRHITGQYQNLRAYPSCKPPHSRFTNARLCRDELPVPHARHRITRILGPPFQPSTFKLLSTLLFVGVRVCLLCSGENGYPWMAFQPPQPTQVLNQRCHVSLPDIGP